MLFSLSLRACNCLNSAKIICKEFACTITGTAREAKQASETKPGDPIRPAIFNYLTEMYKDSNVWFRPEMLIRLSQRDRS